MTGALRTLPLALAAAVAALASPALAAGARIYEGPSTWYVVNHGAIVYSQFYPDGPDHARSYGPDADAIGVFAKVTQAAPAAVARFGVRVQPPATQGGCQEEKTQNALGADGWAFSCLFPIASAGAPAQLPAAVPVSVPAAAPAPPKPAPVQAAASPPKPAPAPPAKVVATAAPPAPPAAAAPKEADADLNARVTAANRAVDERNHAVDERNHAAQAQFEAQQAAYEAEKKAYEAKLAAQKAQAADIERRHAADLAAWEARVKACKAGDTSQCATQ